MDDAELADVKGNISAMVQIGSVGGAALSVYQDTGTPACYIHSQMRVIPSCERTY